MANSKHIAGLLGPILIAISITESINLDIFANTSAHLVYLNGTLLFVAGLAIVRGHNQWTTRWPVLVTADRMVCIIRRTGSNDRSRFCPAGGSTHNRCPRVNLRASRDRNLSNL